MMVILLRQNGRFKKQLGTADLRVRFREDREVRAWLRTLVSEHIVRRLCVPKVAQRRVPQRLGVLRFEWDWVFQFVE